jgi:NADH-quinone oxidoreductase subunit M
MTYQESILSLLIFVPLAGFFIAALLPRSQEQSIKIVTLVVTSAVFILSIPMFVMFDGSTAAMQFVYRTDWIPSWGASYSVGLDGLSLLLVLLTTFTMPFSVLASWKSVHGNVKGFMLSLLLLEFGMIGVFVVRDMLLFYVFWEAMLIPMYLLIGIWGHEERIKAAVKFFIYTMAGSLLMLVAILYMYFQTGPVMAGGQVVSAHSFDMDAFYGLGIPMDIQRWLFLAYALAFAIKVPMFPFHTWLPLAHVEAPTAGSVILAGILLKMGTYGFLRFCIPYFPIVSMEYVPLFSVVAIIGVIYGALVAMVQPDAKKLVAYSSVSHLGYVMLGIFAMTIQGWQGGLIQMINHGVSTGALFLMIGMLYDRRHTRLIEKFGGLWKVMPVFSVIFLVVCLSSLGLPGTNGFVGEFLILIGTFNSVNDHSKIYAAIAMVGVILAAVYLLWMYQRMMYGEVSHEENKGLADLSKREYAVILPFVILIFWLGVYPKTFMDKTEATMDHYLKGYKTAVEQYQQQQDSKAKILPARLQE